MFYFLRCDSTPKKYVPYFKWLVRFTNLEYEVLYEKHIKFTIEQLTERLKHY